MKSTSIHKRTEQIQLHENHYFFSLFANVEFILIEEFFVEWEGITENYLEHNKRIINSFCNFF